MRPFFSGTRNISYMLRDIPAFNAKVIETHSVEHVGIEIQMYTTTRTTHTTDEAASTTTTSPIAQSFAPLEHTALSLDRLPLTEAGCIYDSAHCDMSIDRTYLLKRETTEEREDGEGDFIRLAEYYEEFKHKLYLHPSVKNLFTRIGVRQRTASWFKIRRGKVTASQVCAVINHKKFKNEPFYRFRSAFRTRKQLKISKLGEFSQKDNHILKYGRDNESLAIAHAINMGVPILYERDPVSGKIDAVDFGLLQHPEHSFLAGSPDGVTSNGYVVEVKCPWSEEKKKKIVGGYVPDCYYIQMQMLMEIMDLRGAYFIQYAPETIIQDEKLAITVVERDKKFFSEVLLPVSRDFFTETMTEMKECAKTTIVENASPTRSAEEEQRRKRRRDAAGERVRKREEDAQEKLRFHYSYVQGKNILMRSHANFRSEMISYRCIHKEVIPDPLQQQRQPSGEYNENGDSKKSFEQQKRIQNDAGETESAARCRITAAAEDESDEENFGLI